MSSGTRVFYRLAPVLLPMTVVIAGGLLITLLQSFSILTPVRGDGAGFDAYIQLFGNPWFFEAFAYSIFVGFFSAAIALLLGTAVAYGIWRLPLRLQVPALVYKVPLVLPHLSVAFLVLVLFSRSGLAASVALKLGAIAGQEEFPHILFGGNGAGLIIAYGYKETPFVVLMTLAVYKRIDEKLMITAKNLGATNLLVFRSVVLPHLYPVLTTTFIILFLYAFGAFDIPFLLSESRPQMLSIYVYNTYFERELSRRPEVMAALIVMFIFSVLLIFLYSLLVRRLGRNEGV